MLAKIININNHNYPINPARHEEISHASETIREWGGEKIACGKRRGSSCWLHYESNIPERS